MSRGDVTPATHEAAGLRRKDPELPKHRRPTRLRHTVTAAAVVAASSGVVLGANAWAAEGEARLAEPAVTRIGDLPEGASVARGGTPAGHVLAKVEKHHREQAAKAAREARQRRAAASRSERSPIAALVTELLEDLPA